MKRSAVFVTSMLLVPVLLFSQSGEEAAIRKVLTDMTSALKTNDVVSLKKFWADDYTFISPAGLVQNKTQREEYIKNRPATEAFAYEQPKIRLYGNTAVVNTMVRNKNAGQPETVNPTTLVLVKTGENWKVVNGQGTPAPMNASGSNAEQTIKDIEKELLDALLKGDASASEKYMADSYIFTAPDGMVIDKARAVADLKSGDLKIESSKLEDLKVTIHGNTAIATARSTDKGKYKNTDVSGQFRWTDVFVNQHGKWQLVAGQGTPIMTANK
jgi:ketosteroid isomerase-like protein